MAAAGVGWFSSLFTFTPAQFEGSTKLLNRYLRTFFHFLSLFLRLHTHICMEAQ